MNFNDDETVELLTKYVDHAKARLTKPILAAIGFAFFIEMQNSFEYGSIQFNSTVGGGPITIRIVSKGGSFFRTPGIGLHVWIEIKPIKTRGDLVAAFRVLAAPEELIEKVLKS